MSNFDVRVCEARNLPSVAALSGKPVAYVVATTSEGCSQRTESFEPATTSPQWEHVMKFRTTKAPDTDAVDFVVYHKRLLGSDLRIGHAAVPLALLERGVVRDEWMPIIDGDACAQGHLRIRIIAHDFGRVAPVYPVAPLAPPQGYALPRQ